MARLPMLAVIWLMFSLAPLMIWLTARRIHRWLAKLPELLALFVHGGL